MSASVTAIQDCVWNGRVPLEIRLAPSESRAFDQGEPYIISCPRLSYLPLLLPKLLAFFAGLMIDPSVHQNNGWFSFEDVPLRWHYPVGLLYDMHCGVQAETRKTDPLPWRLVLHFQDYPDKELVKLDDSGKVLIDAYMNSVKEADFLRNGSAKSIMSLSKEHSSGLWESVASQDLAKFQRITNMLIPSSQPIRHIPLRVFLPSSPKDENPSPQVLQSLFAPSVNDEVQTIGSALHSMLPKLFPSKQFTVNSKPVLHGAIVPLAAPLQEILRCAAYADGWLNVVLFIENQRVYNIPQSVFHTLDSGWAGD